MACKCHDVIAKDVQFPHLGFIRRRRNKVLKIDLDASPRVIGPFKFANRVLLVKVLGCVMIGFQGNTNLRPSP
jgi:hypothetical protein